jgi:NADP-dependent 3-hydroxy acid dehydrogenase YdfG
LSHTNVPPYKTAVVTGASSGIGRVTVEKLAAAGLEVHAMARRGDRLEELRERTGCIPHALDVTDMKACRQALDGVEVDVLINNAGVSHNNRFHEFPDEKIDQIIDLNFRAVLHLTRFVLPGMVARNKGHVVIISSMAGHYPMLGSAPYSATKAAVSQFLDVMRLDTNGSRIRWTEIVPGRVATEAFEVVLGDRKAAQEKFLDGKEPLQAEDMADMMMFALSAPAHVNISRIDAYPTRQASGGFVYAG